MVAHRDGRRSAEWLIVPRSARVALRPCWRERHAPSALLPGTAAGPEWVGLLGGVQTVFEGLTVRRWVRCGSVRRAIRGTRVGQVPESAETRRSILWFGGSRRPILLGFFGVLGGCRCACPLMGGVCCTRC